MEKIYISGQIIGQPIEEVTAKFEAAEAMLKAQGYEVVNPLKNGIPANASWEVHVAMDVLILMGCKAIYLLPDWVFSKGATFEKNLAELTGKTIIYEEVPTFQQIKQAIAEGMGVAFYDIVGAKAGLRPYDFRPAMPGRRGDGGKDCKRDEAEPRYYYLLPQKVPGRLPIYPRI